VTPEDTLKLDDGTELIERFTPLPSVAWHDDLADEYAVVRNPRASHGLMLYVKWHGKWECGNGWSHRPVIRYLCDRLGENQAAYTAALTALEASDSDRQKLKARVAELEALCQTIGKQSTEYAKKVGYAEGRAMGLEYRVRELEAELAKEQRDG
jgi:hypothetical protein